MANNTNQDEGAPELQPPGSDFQDFFDLGQESEEDLAGEETLGEEADALANIVKSIEVEISKYQTLSALPILMSKTPKVFSDPLLWWKKKQFQFPILSNLARKYLCIPATEAPSERIFSTASLLLNKFKKWMHPEFAGRMVFIRKHIEWYEALL